MFILWLLIFSSHSPWRKCACIWKPLLNRMQIEAKAQSSRRQIKETISLCSVILLAELWVRLVSWIRQLRLMGLWTQNSAITQLIWLMKALKGARRGHWGPCASELWEPHQICGRWVHFEWITLQRMPGSSPVPPYVFCPLFPLSPGVAHDFHKLSFLRRLYGCCYSKLSLKSRILGRGS